MNQCTLIMPIDMLKDLSKADVPGWKPDPPVIFENENAQRLRMKDLRKIFPGVTFYLEGGESEAKKAEDQIVDDADMHQSPSQRVEGSALDSVLDEDDPQSKN